MASILNNTTSLCPECLKIIDAKVVEYEGMIYLEKICSSHGPFKALHPWSDPKHYRIVEGLSDAIKDSFADGLVINVNSKCNQDCPFCFARANEDGYEIDEPTIDEIKERVLGFMGSIIYLSGGEPTLREDIFDIISEIKLLKKYKVYLFTNGKKLVDEQFVYKLKKSSVDLVIFQLDTFDDEQSLILRGERLTEIKLKALHNLKNFGIPVYLFVMLVKGINTDQMYRLIEFTIKNSDYVKLINLNPVWKIGRFGEHEEFDASCILKEVEKTLGLSSEEFFDNTIFSYNFFRLLERFKRNNVNICPKCEMRCYVSLYKGEIIPLGRLFDLKKINSYLKTINSCLDKNLYYASFKTTFFLCCFLLGEFFCNVVFRAFILRNIKLLFKRGFYTMNIKMFSIIVGTFHNSLNIDLNFVKTCNLFSDYPGKTRYYSSSCVREITMMKQTRR